MRETQGLPLPLAAGMVGGILGSVNPNRSAESLSFQIAPNASLWADLPVLVERLTITWGLVA